MSCATLGFSAGSRHFRLRRKNLSFERQKLKVESPWLQPSTFAFRPSIRPNKMAYRYNSFIINKLRWLPGKWQLDQVRGFLSHLAGTLEMRSLFDSQHGR